MRERIAKRADGRAAYENAKPRLRQSDVDEAKAWKASDVRELRSASGLKADTLYRFDDGGLFEYGADGSWTLVKTWDEMED